MSNGKGFLMPIGAKRKLILTALFVVFGVVLALILSSQARADVVAIQPLYWTWPHYYAESCYGDSAKPIPPAETRAAYIQMKLAGQPDTLFVAVDSMSWVPGEPATWTAEAPGYMSYTFRVVPTAVDAGGTLRRTCPSVPWTWTVVDTCVVPSITDFGPMP